jgi:hypothetical protein
LLVDSSVRSRTRCWWVAFLVPLQGCASFYLHDAATQKQTDSAKEAVTTLKTDAIFDSEQTYLDGLQQNEASVVTAKFAAQRDNDVLQILNGTGPGGADGLTLLRSRIEGYELSLIGAADVDCAPTQKLWRAVDQDPSKIWSSPTDLQTFETTIYNAVPGAKCPAATFAALPVVAPTPSLKSAIDTVIADLTAIKTITDAANTAQKNLETALTDAKNQLSAGKPVATQVNNDLQKLQAALTDANPYIKKYASESLSTEISATIAALGASSKTDTSMTKEERSGIAVMSALFGVGDAFASPPRVPHPNALAAAQSWLQYVASQAATELQNQQIQLRDDQAQLAAVLTEIYYLSRAGESAAEIKPKSTLKGTEGLADLIDSPDGAMTRAIDSAVLYYAAAWTRGFAADALASRHGYLDQRQAKLVSGRAASAAWLGSLKPAVDTLAEYGSGGFDPQVVVQALQALGVGAIAVGVNK